MYLIKKFTFENLIGGDGQQFDYKEMLKKIKMLAEVNHNFETDRNPLSATHTHFY